MAHRPATESLPIDRRAFLRALGFVGVVSGVPLLASCDSSASGPETGSSAASATSTAASGTVRFGVNANAAIPTEGYDAVFAAFTERTGIEIEPNRLLYTEQVNNYLTQAPDDVLIWNAGYRMRFFAEQGVVSDLSGIWDDFGDNATEAVKSACTAGDGNQYLVPFYNYPWVVFFRRSLFDERGYEPPTDLAELTALGTQMQADGLDPIAFADKEGWEAMGTFDIINMRLNGHAFHISLLDGNESWTDDRVKNVFATWAELLPYHQQDPLGRTWQEAAQSLRNRESGMYLMGSFISAEFEGEDLDDLDFFPFPALSDEHGQDAIDAPIDGFMMVAEPDNREDSEELLRFLASAEAQELYLETDPNSVGTALDIDASTYSPLQQRYAELISSTPNIAQYLDRDTRPDFSAPVVLPAFQDFLNDPSRVDSILESVQSQADVTFTD